MEDQKVWVIVPVKALVEAKSRLSPVLTTAQRRNLAFQMAGHTLCVLQTLQKKGLIAGFVTVSRDPVVRTLTQKYGGVFLPEKISGTSPDVALNAALTQAARWTTATYSPDALLILHSDLPFLRWEDLANLLRHAQAQPGQEIALLSPDRHGRGTNSLFLRPPALLNFEFLFGENSFKKYQDFIKGAGLEPTLYPLPNLGFDLDYPEDLAAISRPFSSLLLNSDCPAI
ncbi:MAG: 2-phospho-L-lactate guanylyltransferase [Chloroflexi bacterium]|nr:2-phospho-L-lactate guanylyltransferase [Chloroflexota bacterium]OJW06219.1 MAG: 2-phospho-L-lactate guanylyltransferase [Chloroflexi bacterium 54-19]